MADKREQIVEAMATRFATIQSGSTYESNLGNNVFLWRVAPVDSTELPCIVIRDPREEVLDYTQSSNNMYWQHRAFVEIEIVAASGTDTIADIRKYMRDIQKCIIQDQTWGGLAFRTFYIGSEFLLSQDADVYGGALINLRIDYKTGHYLAE